MTRRITALTALLALIPVLVFAGSASSRTRDTADPTLYVTYAMNCTFTILDDTGKSVTSIPPGRYQVDVRTPIAFGTVPLLGVNDMTACKGAPQFQLTGPGVDLFTTMTAGCEADKVFPETFQPSATYVAVDNNQPSVARAAFSTLASGTPVIPAATYGTSGPGKAESSTDIVGSLLGSIRGTLTAKLTVKGKLTLLNKGKAVSKLKAGRYKVAIVDKDKKAGFVLLGPKSSKATHLTGVRFVGKHSVTIKLTAGRWTYYSALKNIHYLRVTAA
jgi:hypothetical protein